MDERRQAATVSVTARSPILRVGIAAAAAADARVVFLERLCTNVGAVDLHIEVVERFWPEECPAAEARVASASASIIVLDPSDSGALQWTQGLPVAAVLGLGVSRERLIATIAAVRVGLCLRPDSNFPVPEGIARLSNEQRRWLQLRVDRGLTVEQLARMEAVSVSTMKNRLRELRWLIGAASLDEAERLFKTARIRIRRST